MIGFVYFWLSTDAVAPPRVASLMVTLAFLYFAAAALVMVTVRVTFDATFFAVTVTPSLVADSFLLTVVALLSARIAGSFHFVIWPAKIFATVSPDRRTCAFAGLMPSTR